MLFLGFLLTCAGAGLLCLSMRKHYRQVFVGRQFEPAQALRLRLGGFAVLALAAATCSASEGPGLGLVYFTVLLNVAVFAIAMVLSRRTGRR